MPDDTGWSKRHAQCLGCGTTTRDQAERGCCRLCLPVWRLKVKAARWNPLDPGPRKSWPMQQLFGDRQDASPKVLSLHKQEVLRQLDSRLSRLRYEESLRIGPVTQLQLEVELNRVWKLIRPKPSHKTTSPFENGASWIGQSFAPEQMTVIAGFLVDLTRHVPWLPWHFDRRAWYDKVISAMLDERWQRAAASVRDS
jgi:hypothetical protein